MLYFAPRFRVYTEFGTEPDELDCFELLFELLSDFDVLFSQKQYQSIDDVLDDSIVTRKRGKKK